MRFALDDDQVAFRDAVRDLLEKEPPAARSTWDALVEMGVVGAMAADADGGLGLDAVTMVAILEETGYAALAFPIVETAMVWAPLTGDTHAMVATDLGGGDVVPYALDAEAFILAGRLHDRGGVELDAVDTVDPTRRAAQVRALSAGTVVADPSSLAAAFDRGALGTAAQLVGLGQRMLDLTVGYVKERQQFGVPVGSFQAVKHQLADALKELAFARPAVRRAAWSMATAQPTVERDVSMAKAMASDAASFVARKALQCHGAIGYTVEYDLHVYLKRTWALARSWGDAAWHRERIARALEIIDA